MTGSDFSLTVRSAALGAVGAWRRLLAMSRPAQWAWTCVPFLAGALDAERGLTLGVVVGTVYALGPLNLLVHGADDVVTGRSGIPASSMWLTVAATTVPILVVLAVAGSPLSALLLALAGGVAIADALPPVRTRDMPGPHQVVTVAIAVLVVTAGLVSGGRGLTDVPWSAVLAFGAWMAGTLALGAIHGDQGDESSRASLGDPKALAATSGGSTAREASRANVSSTLEPLAGQRAAFAAIVAPRVWAVVAAAGYGAAVTFAAITGSLGALAAPALALYLLLPPMVLLARRDDPGSVRAAAARAWVDRQALDVLVGAWLIILYAFHVGVVSVDPMDVAIVAATAGAGLCLANALGTRVATGRGRGRLGASATVRSLAIVVPCLDDADRLPASLAALREQTYADTAILVVDAGSVDGSAEEAAAWLGADAVLRAPPPPAGWAGHDWARQVGVESTDADLILFVAPDTVLAPVAARLLVERLETGGLDLLSGVPRFDMPTFVEQAAVPGFPLVEFGFVPIWWSALTHGRPAAVAFADPALLLIRRDAHLAAGGFRAGSGDGQAGDPGGGSALARRCARAGRAVGTLHVAHLATRRRDRTVQDVVARWRRIAVPMAGGRLALVVLTMVLEVIAFLVPLLLPVLAIVADGEPALVARATIPLVVLLAARSALAATQRQPLISIAWHPVTVLLTLIGQGAGIWDHVAGRPSDAGGRPVEVSPSVTSRSSARDQGP
ncbi:MAG: glycosyltransferase [Candidatus Limnocylindrales bacterium]